jgi:integrase
MSSRIKYAYLRHNTWIYRRTYPKHLQCALGSALKRSLRTPDARTAQARVHDLNLTYDKIVKNADRQHKDHSAEAISDPINVSLPCYQRIILTGDREVSELAEIYLAKASQRLRPGSYKSVRFAMDLLTSHLGSQKIGDLSLAQGREVLDLIGQLSPNIRKYAQARQQPLAQLAKLSKILEYTTLTPQTQKRIWEQMSVFLDWCVEQEQSEANPWSCLKVSEPPEPVPYQGLTDGQVGILLETKDRVLHGALLFGLLSGLRSGEICGLMAEDITRKGNLGRFVMVRPNAVRLLKSKAAERTVPLHPILEQYLDHLPIKNDRLFPDLYVDRVVKAYAKLRQAHSELEGTVFHSTRKWFVTQCERTGVPEHFAAALVGHQSARSQNRLTYGLYSAGISDEQKREIIDQIRLPAEVSP